MILYADLDAYFASVEQALNPKLKGKPVVIAGDPKKRKGVVATASYEARKFGVHSAQPLFRAKKLCPQCIFIQPDHRVYKKFSKIFYSILREYSPEIELVSPDEAYIDITGSNRLFGNPAEIGKQIKEKIKKRLDINATVGIAISRTVAKIGAEQEKPDGLIVIPEGEEKEYVSPLPIDEFPGIGSRLTIRLKDMGIYTIGDLLEYPRRIIYREFGIVGIRWVMNIDRGGLEKPPERKSVSKSKTLSRDSKDEREQLSLLYYLTEKVCHKLQHLGLYATKISVKIRAPDFSEKRDYQRISPSNLSHDIYPVARKLFKNIPHRWVRLIRIRASELTKISSLFKDQKHMKLENKIREIRGKYGFNSVLPLSCRIYREEF